MYLFQKVPGRMGMIVTLYLISANVYNSVDAPKARGFSYIEVWSLGTQLPILLALCEYGFILHWKKIGPASYHKDQTRTLDESKMAFEDKIKQIDYFTMILSLCCFISFVFLYWIFNFVHLY